MYLFTYNLVESLYDLVYMDTYNVISLRIKNEQSTYNISILKSFLSATFYTED